MKAACDRTRSIDVDSMQGNNLECNRPSTEKPDSYSAHQTFIHKWLSNCQVLQNKNKDTNEPNSTEHLEREWCTEGGKIVYRTNDNNAHLHFCDIRCMFTFDRVKFIKLHTFKPFFYFLAHIIKSFLPCQFCLTQRIARMKTYQKCTKWHSPNKLQKGI